MKNLLTSLMLIAAVSSFGAQVEVFKNATITKCEKNRLGCAPRVLTDSGESFLIDKKYFGAVPATLEEVEVIGIVETEKGHFPNPMAEFQVIKILKVEGKSHGELFMNTDSSQPSHSGKPSKDRRHKVCSSDLVGCNR